MIKNIKKKKKIYITLILLFFVVLYNIYILYVPNFKVISFYEFNDICKNDINIILKDKVIKVNDFPIIKNEEIYLPVSFIKEYIDKNIYYENDSGKLIVTNLSNVIRFEVNNKIYTVNYKPNILKFAIENIGNKIYIPKSILENIYEIKIKYMSKYNIVVVDYNYENMTYGEVNKKKLNMRHEANIKSPILKKLKSGDEFILFDNVENTLYTKVRTLDGLIGYIKSDSINIIKKEKGFSKKEIIDNRNNIKGKINLVWDLITNISESKSESKRKKHTGVNVLSPTWFTFDTKDLNGDMIDIGDKSYVEWAHLNGYKVWPLISDRENSMITSEILYSVEKRENTILNILKMCDKYNLDGINLDFERVPQNYIDYYLQFLRELTPLLREKGIVVSVDTFVPMSWSLYYNRAEIGRIVDYVFVMTYDENTSGGKSGANASICFVEKGIVDTIFEVPSEKVVMGIPLYVRIWKEFEKDGEIVYKIRNVGMDYAYKLFSQEGANFEWLEDKGVYYAEYKKEEGGKLVYYRAWFEDKRSIREKLKLVEKYDLAGIGCWARGLEGEGIFETIYDILK